MAKHNISITVRDSVAVADATALIVCNNNDYVVEFDFDDDWNGVAAKTARISYAGTYTDIVFTGTAVNIPAVYNTDLVNIGVYAEGLTTTPAPIRCLRSVLCEDGLVVEPPADVYAQLIALINQHSIVGALPLTGGAINGDLVLNGGTHLTDTGHLYKSGVLRFETLNILPDSSLDNVLADGNYWVTPNPDDTSRPFGGYGVLEVVGNSGLQRFTEYGSGATAVRVYANAAWDKWSYPIHSSGGAINGDLTVYGGTFLHGDVGMSGNLFTKGKPRFGPNIAPPDGVSVDTLKESCIYWINPDAVSGLPFSEFGTLEVIGDYGMQRFTGYASGVVGVRTWANEEWTAWKIHRPADA